MRGMDPQWIVAVCAVITLLVLLTTTVIGAVVWLNGQFKSLKKEILDDFQLKHDENSRKVAALETLVIRHETILDPEFNGTGGSYVGGRKRQ